MCHWHGQHDDVHTTSKRHFPASSMQAAFATSQLLACSLTGQCTVQCIQSQGKRLDYMFNSLPPTQYLAWLCEPSAPYLFIPSIQLPLSSREVLIQLAQGRHVLTGVSLCQQLLLYDFQL